MQLFRHRVQCALIIKVPITPYKLCKSFVTLFSRRKAVPKFAVFPISCNGKRAKVDTKNGISLLTLDVLLNFELHNEREAILHQSMKA